MDGLPSSGFSMDPKIELGAKLIFYLQFALNVVGGNFILRLSDVCYYFVV